MQEGKQRKRVSAKRFSEMFAELWNEKVGRNREAIREAFSNNTSRTEFMLGRKQTPCERTFLGRLSAKLDLTMDRGWYTLDAVYYEETSSLQENRNRNYVFPACMDVIIEHENGKDVETEMWKLLMFRSPLKVLIFYDYDEADKTTERRKNWLTGKLKQLSDWYTAVDSLWPEAGNTEYLFLIGNRTTAEPTPVWRYAIAKRIVIHGTGALRTSPPFFRKWRISKLKALC